MPSTVSSLSLPLLLLSLLATTVAASIQDARPARSSHEEAVSTTTGRPQRVIPPAPDADAFAAAVFRLKVARPCECLNGGRCQRRTRRCACPLGYDGAHCEIVDAELLAAVEETPAVRHKKPQQVQPSGSSTWSPLVDSWLFYVPLGAAALLLCAFARVAATLIGEKGKESGLKMRRPLPLLRDTASSAASIYTLPLPVRPPPYSEKAFTTSTPASKQQQLQQSDYLAADLVGRSISDYAVIV